MGFRLFKQTCLQIAGSDLPDVRSTRPGSEERTAVEATLKKAKDVLYLLLMGEDKEEDLKHGRTIIVSPHTPNKYGRVYVTVYLPCKVESINHPHLTSKYAGYRFVNVLHFMQYLAELSFDLDKAKELLAIFEVYDFNK